MQSTEATRMGGEGKGGAKKELSPVWLARLAYDPTVNIIERPWGRIVLPRKEMLVLFAKSQSTQN